MHVIMKVHPPNLPKLQAVNGQLLDVSGLVKLLVFNESNSVEKLLLFPQILRMIFSSAFSICAN